MVACLDRVEVPPKALPHLVRLPLRRMASSPDMTNTKMTTTTATISTMTATARTTARRRRRPTWAMEEARHPVVVSQICTDPALALTEGVAPALPGEEEALPRCEAPRVVVDPSLAVLDEVLRLPAEVVGPARRPAP